MQEKTSDFQVTFDDCVYLRLGSEAKRDIYNTFDPDKPFNIHLDPESTECPPLVEIKQEGKTGDQAAAAAADPTLFDTYPLQPREIHLHS